MSVKSKKAFESRFHPFSELSHSILNTYSFLDSSLARLDEYIALNRYPFTAEEVLICLADDEWCEYGLEVNLHHDSVDNKYARLHSAIDNPQFCNVFRACSDGYEQPFFEVRTSVALSKSFHSPFTVKEMCARVKSTFELPHTKALSLVASAFGFVSGNELKQFDRALKYSIFYFSAICFYWVPPIRVCELIKKKYDDEYRYGVPLHGLDREIAEGIFPDGLMETLFPLLEDAFTRAPMVENIADYYHGVEIMDIENWFYNQFARVVWGVELDVDTVKKNIIRTALINHLTKSMEFLYLSAFGARVFPNIDAYDITVDEIQYHWIRTSVAGNKMTPFDGDIAAIKSLQEIHENTFVDKRLPHIFKMLAS